uniref:Uncharacterized protein n=1 Tax=Rhizophora mucronata TaxID=61149 RepID=A0A2P2PN28_RHIMU
MCFRWLYAHQSVCVHRKQKDPRVQGLLLPVFCFILMSF